MITFTRRSLFALVMALGLSAPAAAQAKVRVVTTIQTFKTLAEQIGGDKVEVAALVGEAVDPHFVDPRPSFAVQLNRADLLVHVGLELEKGWLPPLIEQSRNPRIQSGQPGNMDASSVGIKVLDVGTGASRAMGDVHPRGNPHYYVTPDTIRPIARALADRLKAIDAANAAAYDKGLQGFLSELGAKEVQWRTQAQPLRGVKIVTYHKSWSYLSDWLGLLEIGYVEPKPGVPPDPAHLMRLIAAAKSQGGKIVLMESYYARNTAKRVADLAGMKLVPLPSDAGGPYKTYTALVDHLVTSLVAAAK